MKIQLGDKQVWLNYNHLYYFMIVALDGKVVSAADKLSIGAPALSIQLKQFEESVGRPLFMRSHKSLKLTEHGKILLSYAKEIFRIGNEMIQTLHDRATESKVHVQIGALDTIPKHLILEITQKALAMGCTVTLLEGKFDELMRELSAHRIDLVLSNEPPAGGPNTYASRSIARLELKVFGSKAHLPLRRSFPASIDKKPFIVPTTDNRLRHQIDHHFKLHGIVPEIIAETQDVMVQKLMAQKGLGLIVIPEYAALEYLKKKELFLIGSLKNVYEELYLISATRKIENPVANTLMRTFKLSV